MGIRKCGNIYKGAGFLNVSRGFKGFKVDDRMEDKTVQLVHDPNELSGKQTGARTLNTN